MVHLRLFGPASIEGPDGPLSGPAAQRRRIALLAYLALSDRRRATRDKLVALFWPESDGERGRHSLAHGVYVIRRALGEGVLLSEGDDLVLDPERVRSDVEAFRAAVAREDLEAAAGLYAGPLMDGFHVSGAPEFERWLQVRRTALAAEHAGVLERLAGRAGREGRPAEAVRWRRRLAAADPLNARHALGLMEALAAAGDRAGAIRHAGTHARLLETELGAGPDPDVASLAAALRRGEPPAVPTAGPGGGTPGGPVQGGDARSESDSVRRPDDAGDLRERIAGKARRAGPSENPTGRRRLPVGIAAGLLALGAVAWGLLGHPLDARPGFVRDRIVVVPFESRTGDPALDDAGVFAAGLLAEGLARARIGDVVLPIEMVAAAQERGVPGAGPLRMAEAAREFRAGIAVGGTVHRAGDSLVFLTRVTREGGGEVIAALPPVRADPADPGPALEWLRERTVGTVAAHLGREAPEHPFLHRTPTWEAYRTADHATRLFLRRDFEGAAELYRQAYRLDTTAVAYRLWEAVSYSNLNRWSRIEEILAELHPRRRELTRFDAAQLDWLAAITRGDRAGAVRAARAAREEAPHSGLGGYQLAWELYSVGRAREALEVFLSLDPDRGWLRHWGRYWYRLATAYHLLGWHEEEREAAERGYDRHPAGWMLAARVRALAALGRTGELRKALAESPDPAGHYRVAASALRVHGRPAESSRLAREGLELLERSSVPADASPGQRRARAYDVARLLFLAGRLAEARDVLGELREEAPRSPYYIGWSGVVDARLGDGDGARQALERLEALDDEPFIRGRHTAWRAAIEADIGAEPGRVRSLLERAHREGVGMEGFHLTPLFDRVREDPALRDLF